MRTGNQTISYIGLLRVVKTQ